MKMELYNAGMWRTISMLFIDQLKTSDNVHIEQAPIDDDKKEEETWPGILTVVETKEILLWHRKMSTLYEDVNDIHHCSNSWTSSWSECFKYYGNGAIVNLSIDLGTWMFTKNKIDQSWYWHRNESNRLSSTTLHLSKMTLFVYLLKDKLNLENWNVWIDYAIVTMVVFFILWPKLIGIVRFHTSIERMIIILFSWKVKVF